MLPKAPHLLKRPTSPTPRDSQSDQFVRLLIAHDQPLFNYTYSLLLNADNAREVMQDAAVAMWQHRAEYDAARPFFPWASRFAYFHVLHFRKRRHQERHFLSKLAMERLAEDQVRRQPQLDARSRALLVCVEKLPPNTRTLLKHRYQFGWTVPEIAARTGRSVHTLYKVFEKVQESLLGCIARTVAEERS